MQSKTGDDTLRNVDIFKHYIFKANWSLEWARNPHNKTTLYTYTVVIIPTISDMYIYIYIYTYTWYKHACYTMNRHLHIFTISVESCIRYVTYDTCLMHLCTCNELGCSPYIYSQSMNTYWYFTPFGRNVLTQVTEIILMEGMELPNLYIVDRMRANGLPTEKAWDQRPRYWQCVRNNSVRIYGNSRIICFMITTGGKRVNDSY